VWTTLGARDFRAMKLLKKQINEKDGDGYVILRAEEPEDMWHIYNLIHVHDSVKTTTVRKVRRNKKVKCS
jgi:protein pelota